MVEQLRRKLDRGHVDELAHHLFLELLSHPILFTFAHLCLDGRAQPSDVCVVADLLGEVIVQLGQLTLLDPVQQDTELSWLARYL